MAEMFSNVPFQGHALAKDCQAEAVCGSWLTPRKAWMKWIPTPGSLAAWALLASASVLVGFHLQAHLHRLPIAVFGNQVAIV
jgi:hypothetical protein